MLSCLVGGESQAKKLLASCPRGSTPLLDAKGPRGGLRPCPQPLVAKGAWSSICFVELQDPSSDIKIYQDHFLTSHFVEVFFPLLHPTCLARIIFPMAYFLRLSCFPESSFMYIL